MNLLSAVKKFAIMAFGYLQTKPCDVIARIRCHKKNRFVLNCGVTITFRKANLYKKLEITFKLDVMGKDWLQILNERGNFFWKSWLACLFKFCCWLDNKRRFRTLRKGKQLKHSVKKTIIV